MVVASVPLDEVFIPLRFKPGRPPGDKPTTEEERRWYRDFLQRYGHLYPQETSLELERVLFSAEQEYERMLKGRKDVTLADLWQELTRQHPAVVIQGYPGMGKSTQMQRLTLFMARRGLQQPDAEMVDAEQLQPLLIPLLLPLKEYASAIEQDSALTLEMYLSTMLSRLRIDGAGACVLAALKAGRCLVMLDGLDEVSDPQTRKLVQGEIKNFVAAHADVSEKNFNRFLITSRVAGYDQAAFPDYPHYLIAELTPEQINYFLPRWCRASVRSIRHPVKADEGMEEYARSPGRPTCWPENCVMPYPTFRACARWRRIYCCSPCWP